MKNQYAKRNDANQKAIVSDLRDLGIQVILTHRVGEDFPDLLCGWNNWTLLEIKNTEGSSLHRGQLHFLADARGFVAVVCDSDSAIQAVTDPREHCLSNSQQERIVAWLVRNPNQETLSVRKFFDLVAEIN